MLAVLRPGNAGRYGSAVGDSQGESHREAHGGRRWRDWSGGYARPQDNNDDDDGRHWHDEQDAEEPQQQEGQVTSTNAASPSQAAASRPAAGNAGVGPMKHAKKVPHPRDPAATFRSHDPFHLTDTSWYGSVFAPPPFPAYANAHAADDGDDEESGEILNDEIELGNHVGIVIGKSGATIIAMQRSTGTKMHVDQARRVLLIEGTAKQIDTVKRRVGALLDRVSNDYVVGESSSNPYGSSSLSSKGGTSIGGSASKGSGGGAYYGPASY